MKDRRTFLKGLAGSGAQIANCGANAGTARGAYDACVRVAVRPPATNGADGNPYRGRPAQADIWRKCPSGEPPHPVVR